MPNGDLGTISTETNGDLGIAYPKKGEMMRDDTNFEFIPQSDKVKGWIIYKES